jgi:hypothetical protein
MASPILELQRACEDPNARVADLLRRALTIATKLGLDEFRAWIENELNGYSRSPIPAYRRVTGQLRAHNPYHGWIPVIVPDSVAGRLGQREIGQAVAALEDLARGDGTLQVPLPLDVLTKVFGGTEAFELGMVPTLLVDRSQVRGIVDGVRNELLRWALKLEKAGVLGENMTFTSEEVQKAGGAGSAVNAVNVTIGHFSGVLGNVSSSTVQVGDFAAVLPQLKASGVPQAARNELENLVDDLQRAPASEKPSIAKRGLDWVTKYGPMIGALSDTIRGWFEAILRASGG